MALPLLNVRFTTTLAAKISDTASSLTLDRSTDAEGTTFAGTYLLTFDEGTSLEEDMIVTLAGAAGTIVTRGLSKVDAETLVTANRFAHDRGCVVKMTDAILPRIIRLLNGTETFDNLLQYTTALTPVSANDIVRKGYVDAQVGGASYTTEKLIVAGNAGETVSAGQLLYFDTGSNNEWMKCDADTAASVDNVILGIAQGVGTDGNAVTGGVLLYGLDENQSGMTAGDPQFASNTAGGISSSAGTTEVQIGAARSATALYFCPRYNQQLTEAEQDALAGTSGTPSSSNKFVTNDDTSATAAASKVVRSNGSSKIAEGYLNITDAQATDLTDGGTTTLHSHIQTTVTVPAQDFILGAAPSITGSIGTNETGTYCTFADSVLDDAFASVAVPSGATALTGISILYSRTATGDLYLGFGTIRAPIAGGAATADALGNYAAYPITQATGSTGLITVPSACFNALPAVAGGDIITVQIARDATNAADTVSAGWIVNGVKFTFS